MNSRLLRRSDGEPREQNLLPFPRAARREGRQKHPLIASPANPSSGKPAAIGRRALRR